MNPELPQESTAPVPDSNLGCVLGGYELIERIGEGGMGWVYRARHTESGKPAAIKLVKRGMDTNAVLRRFHNERRILAALDHPNIARLIDAGTSDDGLPYFVMEYIAGRPIDEYCDAHKMSVPARLEMFRKICSAVECAHKIHVIHRDIKPENILVTAAGEPKLLDFGIAKILDSDGLTFSKDLTVTVSRVMTPRYASPEQVRGQEITAASDIYSLGVLLYEILSGRCPYKTAGRSAHTLAQAVCMQYPDPPSTVVYGPGPAHDSTIMIAAQRGTTPQALRRRLAGGLDAMVLQALEKEPSRRYQSVTEFSEDAGRFLAGQRILARRPRLQRTRLWLKRRGRTAGAVAVLLLAAALLGIWYGRRAGGTIPVRRSVAVLGFENLSHQASSEWLSTALTEMLSTELAAGSRLRTVPGELISRVKRELALPNAVTYTPETLARLRGSLGADYVVAGSYLAVGEGKDMQVRLDLRLQDTRDGETVSATSETRSASELPALASGAGSLLRRRLGAGEAAGPEAASVRSSIPASADAARNYAQGLERLRAFDTLAARDLLRNAVTMAPDHALSHAALAAASSLLGYDAEARDEARKALELSAVLSREDRLSIEGRYLEITRAWDKAAEIFATLHREFPDNLEYGLLLAGAQTQGGQGRRALETLQSLRKLPSAAHDPRVDVAEAEATRAASDLEGARALAARAARAASSQGFGILAARARLLESRISLEMGEPQRALEAAMMSQAGYQAAGHRQGVAWALNESAGVLTQLGDVGGARARYEEALAVCRTVGDQSCIGTDLDSLGVLRRRQGDLEGALEMHKQALDIRRSVGDRAGVATAQYNAGNVLEVMGDLPAARQAESEALDLRGLLGLDRTAALTMSRLGNIRRRQGELVEARNMSEQAVSRLRAMGDRGGVAMALVNLGMVLHDQGALDRSRAAFEEALAIRRQQGDRNNTAQALAALALVALDQDKLEEARSLASESMSIRQGLGETISLAQSKLVLAEILLAEGQDRAAETPIREAAAAFRTAHARGWEAEAWMALARCQAARGDAGAARGSLEAGDRLLRDIKDARLGVVCEIVRGRVEMALGAKPQAARSLDLALAEASRLDMPGLQFEARLGLAQMGRAQAAQLVSDARRAGFHLIARRAQAALGH